MIFYIVFKMGISNQSNPMNNTVHLRCAALKGVKTNRMLDWK